MEKRASTAALSRQAKRASVRSRGGISPPHLEAGIGNENGSCSRAGDGGHGQEVCDAIRAGPHAVPCFTTNLQPALKVGSAHRCAAQDRCQHTDYDGSDDGERRPLTDLVGRNEPTPHPRKGTSLAASG